MVLPNLAQPPGVPEVCKKSLESSPVEGGLELFIIGKNFLKDTFVVFKEYIDSTQASLASSWEMKVVPDKEYLQQVNYFLHYTRENNQSNNNFLFPSTDTFNLHSSTILQSNYSQTSQS